MSNTPPQPLTVGDFSGGLTDNFINAPLNMAEEMENFLIRPNKSIESRLGSHIDEDTTDPNIPAGNQKINTLINYDRNDTLLVHSEKRIYFRDPVAYTTLVGPVDSNDLWDTATLTNHMAHTQWKKHIFVTNDSFDTPKKLFRDSGGTFQLRTAGMPPLASDPVITPSAAGARSYLYAFLFFFEYTAGSQTFQDFGPTKVIEVLNSDDPSANQNDIASIPVLANGASESYDTAVIKIKIFRTVDGGATLFSLGEVTNGTTVFVDTVSDATISNNATIYTNDGSLDNDPPPLAKFVHTVGDITYYANTKEGTDLLPFDIRQSVPGDPDSCPASLRDTVEDEIRGLSSIQSVPMVFCRNHIYRLEGAFDAQGRGSIIHIRIDDTAGCVSHNSIVQSEDFVFWAGNDGFYASDGYKVLHLSNHFNDRYAAFIAASGDVKNISGTYDEVGGRIEWAVQKDSASGDHDTIFVLDLRWGIKEMSAFTTRTGKDSFRPTSIVYFNNELVRADTRGYVLAHSLVDINDPLIDTSKAPADWVSQAVVWKYKGFSTDFGTPFVRKWVARLLTTARNVTNVTIGISAINDDNNFERVLKAIRYRKNFTWGDSEFSWGDSEFVWNAAGLIQQQRRMPAKGLRCSYMQVIYTNADSIVTNSDTLGAATVNAGAATVTLDIAASNWPVDSVGYFISFLADNYTKKFEVTARGPDTLTFLDPSSAAPSGSQRWQLSGIRKNEKINLLGYTINYSYLSRTQSDFAVSQAGANG